MGEIQSEQNLSSAQKEKITNLNRIIKDINLEGDILDLERILNSGITDIAENLKKDTDFMNSLIWLLNDASITDDNVRSSLEKLASLLWVKKDSEWSWEYKTPISVDQDVKTGENHSPLNMGDGKIYSPYTGENLPNVSWATLYEINVSKSGWGPVEYVKWEVTECLMVVENYPGTTFKVKFDEQWNLCPIAENMDSNVKVLLNNVPDCIQYLQNKAPAGSVISWNARMQDYVITSSNGEVLTIEPSTIAWKWVSSDLGKSLYLLNQANLLRGMGKIANLAIDRDRPQLQYKDKKLYIRLKKDQKRWLNWKWGDRWRDRYPIANIFNWLEDKELNRFVKYYNWEEWKDDWDAKEENKDYKKINIISWRVVTWGSSTYSHNWDYVASSSNIGWSHSEQSSLDDAEAVSKLQLVLLDDSSALIIREKFAIQDGVVVYKSNNTSNKGYYYVSWGKMFCVWYEENYEWKKWEVGGSNYDSYTECVNVCDEWAEKLGELLKNKLSELINESEEKNLSISAQDGKYIFKNGEISFPINDEDNILTNVKNFWGLEDYNPSVEDRLKIVYLASKYVPFDCLLSVDGDGNIIKSVWSDDFENFITKDDLNGFWLDNDDKKGAFIKYLTNVSNSIKGNNS